MSQNEANLILDSFVFLRREQNSVKNFAWILATMIAAGMPMTAAERPAFEVASLKLNPGCEGDHQDEAFSPGRVTVTCITLRNLIQAAYGTFANGPNSNPQRLRFVGAPDWIGSDRYDIAAKADGDVPMDQMFGPMLQVLLEDRFQLKTHLETRDFPVYTLTVAKSGLKLQPSKDGSCIPLDLNHAVDRSPNFCGRMTGRANGALVTDDAYGMGMAEIAGKLLSNRLDRPVVNKTGIAGLFDVHLEFVRDNSPRGPGESLSPDRFAGPSLDLYCSAGATRVEAHVRQRSR
jgi:uncharacterized protein (TIGR03435 family)